MGKAPVRMLGPAGLLVYDDPWWAGVLLPLMTIALPPVALFVVAVPFVWPVGSPGEATRLRLLVAVSSLLGLLVAAPWLDGLVRLTI